MSSQTKKKKIGTRNESSLHRTLKFQYTGDGRRVEVDVGEFVADGIRADGEYIEVQTSNFGSLRKKIKALTGKKAKIRIIYPIAVNKYIEVYAPAPSKRGTKQKKHSSAASTLSASQWPYKIRKVKPSLLYRRKSPKKGNIWSLFDALIHAPELVLIKGVTIEVVLADITEIRVKDGKGSWRRKGISVKDRELTACRERIIFKKKADYLKHFVPFKKGEEFTSTLLAARAAVSADTARKALYVLTKMNVVERIARKGRFWVYCLG